MDNCIFCKIIRGEIPSRKMYEDDDVVAFHDIAPQAPVHFMICPRVHVQSLAHLGPEHEAVMGRIMRLTGVLAAEHGLARGYRTIVNTGPLSGQEVLHIHVHVMGGPDYPLGPMLRPQKGE